MPLTFFITFLFIISYKAGNTTNMAVMEVDLPSGYVADVDALPSVTRAKEVKRIDTSNGDTNVVIYFDRVIITHSLDFSYVFI